MLDGAGAAAAIPPKQISYAHLGPLYCKEMLQFVVLPGDATVSQRPVRNLVQDESGRYWLESGSGVRITPSGKYDFVTMPDGSVRVARPNLNIDFSTHLGLSGGVDVQYAGGIRFGNKTGPDHGKILEWNNNSGHYQPSCRNGG